MRENNQIYNQILYESAKLFDEKGYVKTTTREIADTVGINRGHLHYYFSKKEDILACHYKFYEKKVKYFLKQSKIDMDNCMIFYGLVFACQIQTLTDENFAHDLLLLGRYDLDAYFHLMTNSLCDMVLAFAKEHNQQVDSGRLQDSTEITLKLAIRLLYIKLTYDKDKSFQQIWTISLRHGYFQMGFSEKEIEELIKKDLELYQGLSMEQFYEILARRDYDVLAEELSDL